MLVAGGMTAMMPAGAWVALAGMISFTDLIGRERRRLAQRFGHAHRLTTFRLAMLLTAAALMRDLPVLWLWLLLAANVAVDVVDGHVARRTQQASPFGAVFDREVDAVFALVAYSYFYIVEGLSAWVLIPGLLPYLYRISTVARPVRPAPDHRERLAVVLAGANFVVLLVAMGAPPQLQVRVLLLSIVLVAVSFTISFMRLCFNEYSAS